MASTKVTDEERIMPTLCKPAIDLPEFVVTHDETVDMTERVHADHPQLALAIRLIKNVGVAKRHIVLPVAEALRHPGLAARNATYEREAKSRIPQVVAEALGNAGVGPDDIDALIVVSCTGFVMPSLTAWMVNTLGFPRHVAQIPIAQLGCAAGGSSINRAHDYCLSHPGRNVLIVACEFCSLCYQPDDLDVGNLLSNALFGDAIAAAVMLGDGGTGISIEAHCSYILPGTEKWIAYEVRETGFHFMLDKRVPDTMRAVTPVCQEFVAEHGWNMSDLDYYIIHTGGPKVLSTLRDQADIREERLEYSRTTLRERGNIASASIFDVARRIFDSADTKPGDTFLIGGFGPGITAELAVGTWR
ncbi:type III polyketide synthase [Mycobacterium sp. KBS0706]|uniref:type III polyketide synthase n=1 Tax=Mycobacterium sp. KBS0706 TaxID=2578109 RepID=UPI001C8F3BC3|nr:type III polyketide synthase [Mycobacterium sp. KBS0706]